MKGDAMLDFDKKLLSPLGLKDPAALAMSITETHKGTIVTLPKVTWVTRSLNFTPEGLDTIAEQIAEKWEHRDITKYTEEEKISDMKKIIDLRESIIRKEHMQAPELKETLKEQDGFLKKLFKSLIN